MNAGGNANGPGRRDRALWVAALLLVTGVLALCVALALVATFS